MTSSSPSSSRCSRSLSVAATPIVARFRGVRGFDGPAEGEGEASLCGSFPARVERFFPGELGAEIRLCLEGARSTGKLKITSECWEVGVFDMLSEDEYVCDIGWEYVLSLSVSEPEVVWLWTRTRAREREDGSARFVEEMLRADEVGREESCGVGEGVWAGELEERPCLGGTGE